MPNPTPLSNFIGEDVTVIYTEDGQINVVKGKLVSEDDDFIHIEADFNNLIINKNAVVKVKARKEGDDV